MYLEANRASAVKRGDKNDILRLFFFFLPPHGPAANAAAAPLSPSGCVPSNFLSVFLLSTSACPGVLFSENAFLRSGFRAHPPQFHSHFCEDVAFEAPEEPVDCLRSPLV